MLRLYFLNLLSSVLLGSHIWSGANFKVRRKVVFTLLVYKVAHFNVLSSSLPKTSYGTPQKSLVNAPLADQNVHHVFSTSSGCLRTFCDVHSLDLCWGEFFVFSIKSCSWSWEEVCDSPVTKVGSKQCG